MGNKETESKKTSKVKMTFRLLNIALCLIFVASILLYANLGRIVNSFVDAERIKNIVNKNTNLVLNLEDSDFYTTKDFCINLSAKNIKLAVPDENLPLAEADSAGVEIKIFPLLFKRIK